MTKYYRPNWTCGRYDKETQSAIMFNLITGWSYFFEDKTAELIGHLLSTPKCYQINIDTILSEMQVTESMLLPFFHELCNLGLVSIEKIDNVVIRNYRDQLQQNNHASIPTEIDLSSTKISDSERAYIKHTNKKALVVMMELTYSCSEKCIHCYNPGAIRNDTEKNLRGNRARLNLSQYKKLIDELYKEGTFKVCLTGGDPFSNPDVWDIIDYLYEKDFAVEIFTNAQSLVGKEQLLADYFPCSVSVSIYSLDEKTHDSITRIPGSLAKSIDVLRNLHKLHVPLIIKCVIMQNNVRTYHKVLDLADELNAEIQFDGRLIDSVEGDKCVSKRLRLSAEQLKVVFRDKYCFQYVGKDKDDYGALKHSLHEPVCLIGNNTFCVTPEGYLIPCVSFHAVLGDVKKKSLHEIIMNNKTLDQLRTLNLSQYKECGKHTYCDFCIICPGVNFIEHGTPCLPAENNCYYAKIRYELYNELLMGKDPLSNKNINQVLSSLSVNNTIDLERCPSVSHLNEQLTL